MRAEMWKRKIGENAWNHMLKKAGWGSISVSQHSEEVEDQLAVILNAAVECGWQAPEKEPKIDPEGTKVLWPGEPPVMTSAGLIKFYQRKGHHYLILRLGPLLRGVGQFLLPRLQEVMAAYELQCEKEGLFPTPSRDLIFVGGDVTHTDLSTLRHGAPQPTPSKKVSHG